MDERERFDAQQPDDERVEDLDTPEAEAEEVKGGIIYQKFEPIPPPNSARGGWDGNHNETLVAL